MIHDILLPKFGRKLSGPSPRPPGPRLASTFEPCPRATVSLRLASRNLPAVTRFVVPFDLFYTHRFGKRYYRLVYILLESVYIKWRISSCICGREIVDYVLLRGGGG